MALYLTFNIQTGDTLLKSATQTENKPNEIVCTNNDGKIDLILLPDETKNFIYATASEDIQKGKVVAFDKTTGLAKVYDYGDYAIGIAFTSVQAGSEIQILCTGSFKLLTPLDYIGPLFAWYTGDVSSEPYDIVQQIGYVVNDKLIVSVEIPIVRFVEAAV